jgi:hypothetical protein
VPRARASQAHPARCQGGAQSRSALGPPLPTFSTTVQPPYNHHTATIQSTKDGPPSSITGAGRRDEGARPAPRGGHRPPLSLSEALSVLI